MDIEMRTSLPLCRQLQMPRGVVIIPAEHATVAELADWQADWKTEIVSKILTVRRGALVDVGANCGQTLMDYFRSASTTGYVGFEPNYHCVRVLNDIITTNACSDCSLIPVALSDESGIRKLLLAKDSSTDSSASIEVELRPGRDWDVQFVACYRFDDIRSQIGIGDIGLMKIDVEGAELSVLRGMRATLAQNRHWILCEVLHRDSKVSEVIHEQRMSDLMSFIADMDYICFNVEKSGDSSAVRGLVNMVRFPNKIWTWDNAAECDYMFVPRGDSDLVARLFAK
jgi:FkbM family methyltransferase